MLIKYSNKSTTGHIFLLIPLIIILSIQNTYNQSINTNTNVECLIENAENIFVHLNKKVFISGDSLYFKSYLIKAASSSTQGVSKIIYYQLLDPNMKQVLSWRTNVKNTGSSGRIKLPDSLNSGIYTLLAYTNWMRNFSPAYFFRAGLIIANINDNHVDTLYIPSWSKLSENRNNRDSTQSFPVKKELMRFSEKGSRESSIISVLRLTEDSLILLTNTGEAGNKYNPCRVTIFAHGHTAFDTILSIRGRYDTLYLKTRNWKQGIARISLEFMNRFSKPSIYAFKKPTAKVIISSADTAYQKRRIISFDIKLSGFIPEDTLFASVSISKESPLQDIISQQNIAFDFLFSNEFNNNASDYFSQKSKNNLPSFFWDDLRTYADSVIPFRKEKRGYVLEGHTKNYSTQSPDNNYMFLSYPDTIPFIDYAKIDTFGKFRFLIGLQQDNKNMIMQIKNDENKTLQPEINIQSKFFTPVTGNSSPLALTDKQQTYLINLRNIQLTNDIYFDSNTNRNDSINYETENYHRIFYGEPDRVVRPAEFTPLPDFSEIVANIVPGVRFRKRGSVWIISVLNPSISNFFPEQQFAFLNGVPFYNLGYISTLNTDDIKEIRVVYHRIFFGDLYFNGIVDIETYDGKIPESYLNENTLVFDNKSTPAYNNIVTFEPSSDRHQPDLHSVLYWNPSLKIPANQTIKERCYSSDLNGKYNIVLQGITKSGIPVTATGSFIITR